VDSIIQELLGQTLKIFVGPYFNVIATYQNVIVSHQNATAME
jgi:hypothetical protein